MGLTMKISIKYIVISKTTIDKIQQESKQFGENGNFKMVLSKTLHILV